MSDDIYIPRAAFYTREEIESVLAQIPVIEGSEIIIESTGMSDAAHESLLEVFGLRKMTNWHNPNVIHVNFKKAHK